MFMTSRNFIGSIFSTSQPNPAAMHLGIHHLWRRFSLVTGGRHLYDWLPNLQKSLEERIGCHQKHASGRPWFMTMGQPWEPIDIYSNKPYAKHFHLFSLKKLRRLRWSRFHRFFPPFDPEQRNRFSNLAAVLSSRQLLLQRKLLLKSLRHFKPTEIDRKKLPKGPSTQIDQTYSGDPKSNLTNMASSFLDRIPLHPQTRQLLQTTALNVSILVFEKHSG